MQAPARAPTPGRCRFRSRPPTGARGWRRSGTQRMEVTRPRRVRSTARRFRYPRRRPSSIGPGTTPATSRRRTTQLIQIANPHGPTSSIACNRSLLERLVRRPVQIAALGDRQRLGGGSNPLHDQRNRSDRAARPTPRRSPSRRRPRSSSGPGTTPATSRRPSHS